MRNKKVRSQVQIVLVSLLHVNCLILIKTHDAADAVLCSLIYPVCHPFTRRTRENPPCIPVCAEDKAESELTE